MADNVNGMQANMGLSGVATSSQGIATPTPADTSLRLSMEAAQRQQQSHRIMSSVPLGASQSFQQQFQQQMYNIQAQQSMNPYAAQALSHSQAGGPQQYLPSPVTMTPASSGVFRPPPAPPMMTPIAPTYTPSRFDPFAPQAPTPMFGGSYAQQIQQQHSRSISRYSMGSQVPGAMGYGAGIMAGAGLGAAAGSILGPMGMVAGAGIGALGAGMSGVAGGMGNFAQGFMRPSMQRHEMGAGIQNMSQNWVTTGADVGSLGRGLGRDSSLNLAGQIQDLAGSRSFKRQTGGMFNSQDLMQITRQGGESGLFDMSQEVPKIKQKLQETAGTIKQFMELTNDASVTNVIRQMGRLQQFGMNQKEMITAAQGMRSYARAAGTSIEGIQQIGGLPGAATFQGAGLTAGQGFKYGNAAAASAHQMVSSGAITHQQLALQGGVQGMAQTGMQSQAALASMPMYAASQSRYSNGSWGIDPSTAGRGDGAFGMVQGTMQSMNEAVQQGGVGALAMFQMKQKELSDTVLASMSPMQALKQRMSMAMSTGQSVGMQGEQALAMGGGIHFGMGAANQMSQMASSPQFWETKRQAIRQRQLQLGVETAERNRSMGPGLMGRLGEGAEALGITGAGSWGRKTGRAFSDVGSSFSGFGSQVGTAFSKGWNEHLMGTDVITSRFNTGVGGLKAAAMSGDNDSFTRQARRSQQQGELKIEGGVDVDQDLLLQAAKSEGQTGVAMGEHIGNVLGTIVMPGDTGTMASGAMTSMVTPRDIKQEMAYREMQGSTRFLRRMERIKDGVSDKDRSKAYSAIGAAMGSKGKNLSMSTTDRIAKLIDQRVRGGAEGEGSGMGFGAIVGGTIGAMAGPLGVVAGAAIGAYVNKGGSKVRPSDTELKNIVIQGFMGETNAAGNPMSRKEAESKWAGMSPKDKKNYLDVAMSDAKENSLDPAAYDWLEGDVNKNTIDQIETATNDRIEKLETDAYTATENALNLDELGFGFDWMKFGYSDDDKKMQKLASETSDEFGSLAYIAASQMGAGDEDDLTKEIRKIDAKDQERLRKKLKGMTKEQRRQLADVGGSGVSRKDINAYGASRRAMETQTGFGSSGFRESFGQYSDNLDAFLGAEGSVITGESVANQFTEENLTEMSKHGGVEGRKFAKLAGWAKYKGTDEKKQQLALESRGELVKIAGLKAKQDKDGIEENAKIKGDGSESEQLKKDLAAVDAMAAMFADFKPSIKEFAKGTSDLSAAMASDYMTKVLESDQ